MSSSFTVSPQPESRFRPRSLTPMVNFSRKTPDPGQSVIADFYQNAYIVPKSKLIALSPQTAPVTSQDSDTTSKSALIHRVSDLERQHRQDKARIENLEKQVIELTMKYEEMKAANKMLLEQKSCNGGEVHALYQDLFLTDLKQQMNEKTQEAAKIRSKQVQTMKELESLKRDNFQYQATLKRYRTLLADALKKPPMDFADSSSFLSAIESDASSRKQGSSSNRRFQHLLAQDSRASSPVGLKLSLVSLSKLEKLVHVLSALNKAQTVLDICKIISRGSKSLTKSQKLTLFLIGSKIKDDYIKCFEKTPDFIGRVRVGNEWIMLHTHDNADQEEPIFRKLDDLKFSSREHDSLVVPILIEDQLSFAVQCQDKVAKDKKKSFTAADEVIIKIIGISVASRINTIWAMRDLHIEFQKATQIANIASEIVLAKNHKDIANRLRKVLAGYCNFEVAGIVFLDSTTKEFFVMVHDPNAEEFYSEGVLRFPMTMGITSEALKKGGVMPVPNPRLLACYNPQIDNVAGAREVRNILFGAVKDYRGNSAAVVQLINKKDNEISEKDCKTLESLLGMLGGCVSAANITIEQFSLTIEAKRGIEKVVESLAMSDLGLVGTDTEISSMFNQMMMLRHQLSEWSKSRKMNVIQ
ncbi:unnamed protein product [Blepharisma stoltei]|uniref:GAF domain-containing protein n=1 Tax=Blepharisma stoltei TaxID=1481888 RepID=A0AAU9JPP7_9CILI|nr:unnamed protein product [Blepharisma stoltei]